MSIKSPVRFSKSAKTNFVKWLREYGKPHLIVDAFIIDAEETFEYSLSHGDDLIYELGSSYTIDGNPHVYHASASELVPRRIIVIGSKGDFF